MTDVPTLPCAKVFVSSTTMDLWEYRKAAYDVIEKVDRAYAWKFRLDAVTMDTEPATGERETAVDTSTRYVRESQWIVLIVAWNYGYIAPDGRSVTEWEYRYAVETCKPAKPVFIFLAAEETDEPKRYYYDPTREKVNLAKWKERGGSSDEQWNKLQAFKETVRRESFKLFTGLEDFKEMLEDTLRRRIDRDLGPPTDPLFLELLLKLRGQVTPCIRRVKLLANLKRMHDALHTIRYRGVRRWREEVLPEWLDGGLDSPANVEVFKVFVKGLRAVDNQVGKLDAWLPLVSPEVPDIGMKITKVLEVFKDEVSDDSAGALVDRDKFQRTLELFARRVEFAFAAANKEMSNRSRELQQYVLNLQESLSLARKRKGLSDEQDAMVQDEIKIVGERFDALRNALDRHDAWQEQHGWLERVDSSKDSDSFPSELDALADRSYELADLLKKLELSEEATAQPNDWLPKIESVKAYLQLLVSSHNPSAYNGMRKTFDDLFFLVDKATLAKVEEAEQRVLVLEQALTKFDAQMLASGRVVIGSAGLAFPNSARPVPSS